MKLTLVDDWHQAWKWSSMRVMAVGATVQSALMAFPTELKQYLPDYVLHWGSILALGSLVLGMAGRVTTVQPKSGDPQ